MGVVYKAEGSACTGSNVLRFLEAHAEFPDGDPRKGRSSSVKRLLRELE